MLALFALSCHRKSEPTPAPIASAAASAPTPPAVNETNEEPPEFAIPSGLHVRLSCANARAIVAQADRLLAFEPRAPKDADFARELIDWLDPYGHWSATKGASVGPLLQKRAGALLSEVLTYASVRTANDKPTAQVCPVSDELGRALEAELAQLHQEFQRGKHTSKLPSVSVALESMPTAPSAKELAFELGARFAALEHLQDPTLSRALAAAEPRLFPHFDDPRHWGDLIRTAAVRSYVRLIDAHGGWAPRDEAMSIYDLDLLDMGPMVLWQHADVSLIGAVIRDGALAPLQAGDVVLAVDDLWLASLPPEQVDEIAIAALAHHDEVQVVVHRNGEVHKLTVSAPKALDTDDFPSALELEMLPYGNQRVAVVRIHDVYDYLGSDLGQTLGELRKESDLAGLLIDLRDNGGGAMDGALDALAYFLPARPMFPMQNRTRTTEVDLTRNVPEREQWKGPVAVLVDRGTASAAEMLAGALAAYGRASVIGTRTFGKGCIQEYIDDDAKLGVFRITTALYALPDGTPVQRTGISPDIPLSLPAGSTSVGAQREAQLGAVGPAWRGPDVRTWPLPHSVQWPKAEGTIGPCQDAIACRALTALSRERRIARAKPPERR